MVRETSYCISIGIGDWLFTAYSPSHLHAINYSVVCISCPCGEKAFKTRNKNKNRSFHSELHLIYRQCAAPNARIYGGRLKR
eukprot:1154969-Pelagomonas_calceolata.AAC.5